MTIFLVIILIVLILLLGNLDFSETNSHEVPDDKNQNDSHYMIDFTHLDH